MPDRRMEEGRAKNHVAVASRLKYVKLHSNNTLSNGYIPVETKHTYSTVCAVFAEYSVFHRKTVRALDSKLDSLA